MARSIDIENPSASFLRMLSYGASGSGKTRHAGTWPNPLFLSEESEGGHKTLMHMPRSEWYDRKPEVWLVNGPGEMGSAVKEAGDALRTNPNRWGTIVTDSFSLYLDAVLLRYAPDRKDGRQLYGDLALHIVYLMSELHKLPAHVLHLCLVREPQHEEGKPSLPGMPLIVGKSMQTVPARTDAWLYHKVMRNGPNREFVIRTQTDGFYQARHRFGDDFPDPLPAPNFRDGIEAPLGLTAVQTQARKAVPPPPVNSRPAPKVLAPPRAPTGPQK